MILSARRREGLVLEVRTTEGYEEAFRGLGGVPRTGIVQLGSPILTVPPTRLGEAALKYRLPTISFYTPHGRAGALMSYGPNLELYFPRAAILGGRPLSASSRKKT